MTVRSVQNVSPRKSAHAKLKEAAQTPSSPITTSSDAEMQAANTLLNEPSSSASSSVVTPLLSKSASRPKKFQFSKITDFFKPKKEAEKAAASSNAALATVIARKSHAETQQRDSPAKTPRSAASTAKLQAKERDAENDENVAISVAPKDESLSAPATPTSSLAKRLQASLKCGEDRTSLLVDAAASSSSSTKLSPLKTTRNLQLKQLTIEDLLVVQKKRMHQPSTAESLITHLVVDDSEDESSDDDAKTSSNPFLQTQKSPPFANSLIQSVTEEPAAALGCSLDAADSQLARFEEAFSSDRSLVDSMRQIMLSYVNVSEDVTPLDDDRPFVAALPPQMPEGRRMTLVLDLDETLVHCITKVSPEHYDFGFPIVFRDEVIKVYCRMRPHLKHFLEVVSEMFEVVLFTASHQTYASQLLDILDVERRFFHHRLYREACTFSHGLFVKNLSILGRDLSRTVIVDNAPHSFLHHVENGIPIASWFSDPNDRELLKLIVFLREMAEGWRVGGDVRHFIRAKFEWFNASTNRASPASLLGT